MLATAWRSARLLSPAAPSASALGPMQVRFATKKAGGSTKNGRDSKSKRLGVKIYGG